MPSPIFYGATVGAIHERVAATLRTTTRGKVVGL